MGGVQSRDEIEMARAARSDRVRLMKLEEIEACAMKLPDSERAALAADLLCSLPAVLCDEDEGVAEARRRSRELAEDPSIGFTWEEIRRDLGR